LKKLKVVKKTNKKLLHLGILFAIALASLSLTYGAYWIYSNIIQSNVEDYTLTLTETHTGRSYLFTALLKDPTGNPVNSATIYFYNCTNVQGTISKQLGTNSTTSGIAILRYTIPDSIAAGTSIWYKAAYSVTP
jgi:hypothetical protein